MLGCKTYLVVFLVRFLLVCGPPICVKGRGGLFVLFFCFLRSFSLKSVNVVSVCGPPICVRDAEVCLFCFLFFEVVLTEEF